MPLKRAVKALMSFLSCIYSPNWIKTTLAPQTELNSFPARSFVGTSVMSRKLPFFVFVFGFWLWLKYRFKCLFLIIVTLFQGGLRYAITREFGHPRCDPRKTFGLYDVDAKNQDALILITRSLRSWHSRDSRIQNTNSLLPSFRPSISTPSQCQV